MGGDGFACATECDALSNLIQALPTQSMGDGATGPGSLRESADSHRSTAEPKTEKDMKEADPSTRGAGRTGSKPGPSITPYALNREISRCPPHRSAGRRPTPGARVRSCAGSLRVGRPASVR